MQVDNYLHFIERLLFYTFHQYCSMVQKGKYGFKNLQEIHCICIIENTITPFTNYYNQIRLLNEFGELFSRLVSFHVIELGKFPIKKHEFHKITNEMEELVYTLKHAHNIDPTNKSEIPNFWDDDWLDEVLHKLDVSKLDPQQRVILDMSIVRHNLYLEKQQIDRQESREKGREEGREEERKILVLNLNKKRIFC